MQALPFCFIFVQCRILPDELGNIHRDVVVVNLASVMQAICMRLVSIGGGMLGVWLGLR